MISKLSLKNFRCFHDFTMDGIRPITLIAGTNNTGKSTILESVFLFMNRYSSNVFLKLNEFRGIYLSNLLPQMIWEPVFSNMNIDNDINIAVTVNEELQTAIFSKDTSFSMSSIPKIHSQINVQELAVPTANFYPLKFTYELNNHNHEADNYKEESFFIIREARIILTSQQPIKTKTPYIHYVSSRIPITTMEAAEWFGKVELAGGKARCIEALNTLDKRIRDLSVIIIGGISGIFADIGLSSRLSVNMLGDGVTKLIHIVLLMLANPGSIILIDEIENGFHYSFFPKLWEIIGKLSVETKCQIFATTHSYECINGAVALAANADNPELFRFVRIEQNNGNITPHVFDNDSFEYAVKSKWEVR